MKYRGMPSGMWLLFKKPFRNCLVTDLGMQIGRRCTMICRDIELTLEDGQRGIE